MKHPCGPAQPGPAKMVETGEQWRGKIRFTLHCRIFSIQETLHIPYICHFFYTDRIFENQILHPKKTTKITKNTKNVSEKVIYMHFFHSFWKNLHLTENFYTDMSVVSVTNMRYEAMVMRKSLKIILWPPAFHPKHSWDSWHTGEHCGSGIIPTNSTN